MWAWGRLDEAEHAARAGIKVLKGYPPQQQIQCLGLLIQCSLARGNLDNARSYLSRLENLMNNGVLHSDWIANADKVRLIYWQMTGDAQSASHWMRHTDKPAFANNHFCRASGAMWRGRRSCWATSAEVILDELNENAHALRLMSDLNRNPAA